MNIRTFLFKVKKNLSFSCLNNCHISKNARICSKAELNNVQIGKFSYVGHSTKINNCSIGNFCSIAGDVIIGGGSHPISWISTSPVFHSNKNVLKTKIAQKEYSPYCETFIGNDVWIGTRAIIKAGIKIGDGAIIGMGSVVTHDIPEYEIWAGNPARFIKKRFDGDTVDKIKKSNWWNAPIEKLSEVAESADSPIIFLEQFQEDKNDIKK